MSIRTPSARGRARTAGAMAVTIAAVGLVACSDGRAEWQPPDLSVMQHRSAVEHEVVPLGNATALPAVLGANDTLGLSMLQAATEQNPGGNVVVSPFSALVALSMLAEGARGETAVALDGALGASGEERTAAIAALRSELHRYDGDPALATADEKPERPLLHLADRIVVDDGFVPEPGYLDALARGYDAGVDTTDLGSPEASDVLGEWLDVHTGGLIEESAIRPHAELRLVLQDVVLFAARWQEPFDASATSPRPFLTSEGEVSAETMSGSSAGEWAVVREDGWTTVRLPYSEGFHADLVLPPLGTDPARVDPALLERLRGTEGLGADTKSGNVAISVPTLDLAPPTLDLAPVLVDVGLGGLMDGESLPDLTGISKEVPLVVDQVLQQARLLFDEDGTVAVAVTEVGVAEAVSMEGPEPIMFDRPFLLRLGHDETGATLFLAAVRDPRTD